MRVNAIGSGQGAESSKLNQAFNSMDKAVKLPEGERTIDPTKTSKTEPTAQEIEITEEKVIKVIEKANQKFEYYDTRLEFSIHEQTRQIMVKMYKNDELIREIPPEKILDMVAKMMEMAGLIVDETA